MLPRFHPLARLLLCLVGLALSLAIVGFTISGAIATTARWMNRPPGPEIAGFFANDTNKLVSTLLVYPFVLLCLIFCRRILDRRSLVSLGLRPGRAWKELSGGALCGALAMSFLFGVLWLSGKVSVQGPSPEAFEAGALVAGATALVLALTFFCVGFMEEFAFRGYALHNLNAWLGWRAAVVFQAAAFAIIHPLNELQRGGSLAQVFWDARWALINIAMIAIFFAQCYRKTGALWFPIGFHAAWNFFLGTVFSLPVSGLSTFRLLDVGWEKSIWTGGTFGAEASPFLTPILATLIFLIHRLADHPQAILDLNLLKIPIAPDIALDASSPVAPVISPGDTAPQETEERAPNRFKSTMRPASETPQLDPKIFQTAPPPPTFSAPAPIIAQAEPAAVALASVAPDSPGEFHTDIGDAIAAKTGTPATAAGAADLAAQNTPQTVPQQSPALSQSAPGENGAPKSTPEFSPNSPQSAPPLSSVPQAPTAPQSPQTTPPQVAPAPQTAPAPKPNVARPKAPRW